MIIIYIKIWQHSVLQRPNCQINFFFKLFIFKQLKGINKIMFQKQLI